MKNIKWNFWYDKKNLSVDISLVYADDNPIGGLLTNS